jgi:hypothetical protein
MTIDVSSLTDKEREVLALFLSRNNERISAYEFALAFWPDRYVKGDGKSAAASQGAVNYLFKLRKKGLIKAFRRSDIFKSRGFFVFQLTEDVYQSLQAQNGES